VAGAPGQGAEGAAPEAQVFCPDTLAVELGVPDSCGCSTEVVRLTATPDDPCRFPLLETPMNYNVLRIAVDCKWADSVDFDQSSEPIHVVLTGVLCDAVQQDPSTEVAMVRGCTAILCL
jgi:hypothetical protein